MSIECRHGPCKAGAEVAPYTMAHFLAMEDRGEHRQHRLHQHPRVPAATRTDFHVGRIPGLRMEAGVCEDDHHVVKLGNQGLKMRVVDVLAVAQSQAQIKPHWFKIQQSLPPTIQR